MECSVAIQFLPMDAKDDKTICKQVDAVIAYIASTGVNYFVAPFETTIEGSYEQCLEIVKNCPLVGAKAGCHSMMTYVKINYHPQGKVLSTAQKLSPYTQHNATTQLSS
ncbi:thiamine-binding protein [Fannyhessea vaginae]|uniref:thiamine-binding protein n=1 Tax=Fannyhessea vaginae TaxID=82135 RepID=UPI00336A806B